MNLLERITVEPGKCGGRPCIRGLRFPVSTLVGYLAAGMSSEQMLEEWPDLEAEDIRQALQLNRAIDAQIRPRAFGIVAVQMDIHFHVAVDSCGIDSDDLAGNDSVTRVDGSNLANRHILRLCFWNLQFGFQKPRFRNLGEDRSRNHMLSGLDRDLLNDSNGTRADLKLFNLFLS